MTFLFRFLTFFICFWSVVTCSSTAYKVVPEPTLEQQTAVSEETCLRSFLFFDRRPCVYFKAEKDNSTNTIQYSLVYEIGTFDVDLPLGVSLKLGDVWFNLRKTNTDYSDTILVGSALPADLIPKIGESSSVVISYTNRKGTMNYPLSLSSVKRFQSSLSKLVRSIEPEPKMTIQKK